MARKDLIKLIAVVFLFAVSATLVARYVGDPSRSIEMPPDQIYFYDLASGDLFAGPTDAPPPITAPSGEDKGVIAVVYTCGECVTDQLKIAYLEKRSDEGKKAYAIMRELSAAGKPTPEALVDGVEREHFVALPPATGQQPQWASLASPYGQDLTVQYRNQCGEDINPSRCNPQQ